MNVFNRNNRIRFTSRSVPVLGAELIEQLRQKRMHEQDEQERRILEKIKAKMDRIKATQQKMQGPFQSTSNHYVGEFGFLRFDIRFYIYKTC